jgi:hypothetical protein
MPLPDPLQSLSDRPVNWLWHDELVQLARMRLELERVAKQYADTADLHLDDWLGQRCAHRADQFDQAIAAVGLALDALAALTD